MNRVVALLMSFGLASCAPRQAIAPSTVPEMPAGWASRTDMADIAALPREKWWGIFGDATLDRIMSMAGETADSRIAAARLAEAEALLAGARAQLRPETALTANGAAAEKGDGTRRQSTARAGLDASWTIDVFGSTRARVDAARAELGAAEMDIRAVRIAARAGAAKLYFSRLEALHQRAIARSTIRSLELSLALARSREAAGLDSGLDKAEAATALAAAKAAEPGYIAAATTATRGLEVLLGLVPGGLELSDDRGAEPPAQIVPPAAVRVPARLLAARPDVAASEQRLAAAGFAVAASRADFYPKLVIAAGAGAQAISPASPIAGSGIVGSLLGNLTLPVLERGRLTAGLAAAEARRTAAAEAHRQVLIGAVGEVEGAASTLDNAIATSRYADEAVESARTQLALAQARYRAGAASFLNVIAAEQSLFDLLRAAARARAEAARAHADLYAAVGLGGEPEARPAAGEH